MSEVAEVYASARAYGRTNTWDTPRRIVVSAEDVERGVAFEACQDCCGTGHFPVPWEARGDGSDFCVACKGQGLAPVMV